MKNISVIVNKKYQCHCEQSEAIQYIILKKFHLDCFTNTRKDGMLILYKQSMRLPCAGYSAAWLGGSISTTMGQFSMSYQSE